MATPSQINANRLNASFSTGPRTTEGKAASARNATKHGLSSAFKVLAHEDQGEFDSLVEQLHAHYRPANVVQRLLVDQMAQAQWRLSRAQRLQTVALDLLAGCEDRANPDTRIVEAMLGSNPNAIGLLDRYAAQAERSFHKAYRELQAAKQRQTEAAGQPRPTAAAVRRVPEAPVHSHPTRPNAVRNEPDSPATTPEARASASAFRNFQLNGNRRSP